MSRQLFTTWSDYQAGVDRLLALATREIRIYDGSLGELKLDAAARSAALQRLLHGEERDCLQIALRDASRLPRECPRLMQLLGRYAHIMTVRQTPEQLGDLRDSLLLVDRRHGLIRFDRDQARCKLLIDEEEELRPYLQRFEEIWGTDCTPISPTTLGL